MMDNQEDINKDPGMGWVCKNCTLINTSTTNICQACYKSHEPTRHHHQQQHASKTKDIPIDCAKHHTTDKPNGFFDTIERTYTNLTSKLIGGLSNGESSTSKEKGSGRNDLGDGSMGKKIISKFDNVSINSRLPTVDDVIASCNDAQNIPSHSGGSSNSTTFSPKCVQRQRSMKSMNIRADQQSEAIEQWNGIVKFCRETNIPFVDDSFPPCKKSLHTSNNRDVTSHKVSQWYRPSEIHKFSQTKIKWEVFRNPRPSDIIQGTLGDCWFLSALAVLCEKPELLENIMITKEVCEEGVYQVRICKNGKWEVLIIDDLLPCDANGNLVYSQAARSQLWVPIIEKAVAKSFGCYEALIAGRCIEGLQMLTGCPCESIVLHNKPGDGPEDIIQKDMIWAQLLSCRNAGYLMGASCGGDIMDESINSLESFHLVGLEAQHAYSVLDVKQVDEHRLIRLRNPWGRGSWTGDWADDSPLWTPELRDHLGAHGSDEGVFWISLEDMISYFDSVDVCKYLPEWTEVAVDGTFAYPGDSFILGCHVTVFAPTEVNITLFQESNRGSQTESLATMDLLIGVYNASCGSADPSPIKYICHSSRKIKPSMLCNVFLDIGEYLILPISLKHWNSSVNYATLPKYVLSIHSSKPVLVDQVPLAKYSYSDALFLLVEKFGLKHEGIPGVTCYYMSTKMSGLIVAAEIRRSDVHLIVDCDCSNSFNVVPTRGELITSDCLPPMHRQILTVLTQLEGSDGYSVSHKLKFRVSPRNAYNDFGSHQYPLLLNGLSEIHNPKPL